MIKYVFAIRRHPGLSAEEFHRYWAGEHAEKVREVAEAIGAVRYVQCHALAAAAALNEAQAAARGGMDEGYDGVAELWWEGELEDIEGLAGTEAAQQAAVRLIEDEARFIDLRRSTIFMTREIEVFDRRATTRT